MRTGETDHLGFAIRELHEEASVNELLEEVGECDRAESYFAWCRYVRAEAIFSRCCDQLPEVDERVVDSFSSTAARLALVRKAGQRGSENLLGEACALVHRIPKVGDCLHDGIISPWHFKLLVSRTDLIEGMPYCAAVDAAIAAELRRAGFWSRDRLADMADRMIFRQDPNAVRRRRQAAKDSRGVWTSDNGDGMSELAVIASAEDVLLANAAIDTLARSVCKQDPRTLQQRRSDAVICRLQQVAFECQCDGGAACEASVPDEAVSDVQAQIVLHVICQCGTLNPDETAGGSPDAGPTDSGPTDSGPTDDDRPADETVDEVEPEPAENSDAEPSAESQCEATDFPESERPGFLDGYGVIAAEHVREIAARPGTLIRFLNKVPDKPLSSHLPSDRYRPSAALDTYVRARDGYCTAPGCAKPAWKCELDHVSEFDHQHPERGGQTTAEDLSDKCKFHHLLKTFGDWLDDQYVDHDGYTHVEFRTPEGLVAHSAGHNNEDLFPALRSVRFEDPAPGKTRLSGPKRDGIAGAEPQRRRPRTEEKHARRRYERKKNRDDRAIRAALKAAAPENSDPPPF